MRWLIAFLALAGIVAAFLALREHYRTGASPCSVNEKWDCGAVNKSSFAVIGGLHGARGPEDKPPSGSKKNIFAEIDEIPVADIGIAGYLLLLMLAIAKQWRLLAAAAVLAWGFSLYLAHIEKDVLGVWCIYCVISLGIITLITVLSLIALGMNWRKTSVQSDRAT
ncbi:MAG TPA: vitamin K epoxide reductase family protein [Candidatus Acidoferrales bacterium]|nr:vitamin K epoxide reductase family protein [Candidatus Acidoferrales bacterium]